jgi:hypothetical protein
LFKIQKGKPKNQRFMRKAFGKIKENQNFGMAAIFNPPSLQTIKKK